MKKEEKYKYALMFIAEKNSYELREKESPKSSWVLCLSIFRFELSFRGQGRHRMAASLTRVAASLSHSQIIQNAQIRASLVHGVEVQSGGAHGQ